jgi:hypothetical protein
MTVTRVPIPWHHLVCAARRPGKAVLVASGPVAGLERVWRRSGSWRGSDAGAGRSRRPRVSAVPAAGNGRRSSTRTAVCRETFMASTASARARRRRSARPAGACAADSVRARREGAHARSAGRSPRLRTSGAGYPQRSVDAGHRAGRRPRSAYHTRAPGSFRCRRPDGARARPESPPDPDPPVPSVTSSMTSGDSPENTVLTS